ncbi:MAG: FtsX-like permease family protein [Acidobacteria bacterium]|nr:FtsX-like permease family protein [Acidobacteriota bacterium]
MLRVLISRLLGLGRHRRMDQEFDEEAAAHLEMLAQRFVARGMSPEEARGAARKQFGGVTRMKEDLREMRAVPALETLLRDARHTLRRLARSPVFTAATVLTLALGIGANTAIFSVIHGVLLKPLPFPGRDRLVSVWQTAPGVKIRDLNPSIADYVTYREHSRTFEDVALWNGFSITVTEFAEPESVAGMGVTFRLFPMLGVKPVLGRLFTEKDEFRGSPRVLMLGHGYWMRRFGGDPKVIGRRIMADGAAREIIGVLPPGFWFMDQPHHLVVPILYDRANVRLGGYNFQGVARLRPGVDIARANADLARMISIEMGSFPAPEGMSPKMFEEARLAPNIRPLMDDLVGDIGKTLWVVMATVGIVLLIACANIANLLLARTEARAQELAVRRALGASKGRIGWEIILESLILALMGGGAGAAIAAGMVRLVVALTPVRLPRLDQIAVDSTALLFTFVISSAAGLAFGALPVLKHGGVALAQSLRAGGRNASSSRHRHFARNMLTAVQVALALVLLIGSALMIRTFQAMRKVDPGFGDPGSLQTLRVSVPDNATRNEQELLRLHQNLAERLSGIPGVSQVSMINGLPMTGFMSQDPILASDRTYAANQIPPLRRFITAMPGTFSTLSVPLRAGRELTWTDVHARRRVAVISESFAREYWGSAQAAVGRLIRSTVRDPWTEVIGVVSDIRHDGVDQRVPTVVYWAPGGGGGRGFGSMTYLLRGPRAGSESY